MRTRNTDTVEATSRVNVVDLGPQASYHTSRPVGTVYLDEGELSRIDDIVGDFEGENPCYHFSDVTEWKPGQPYSVVRLTTPAGICHQGTVYGPGATSSLNYHWAYHGIGVPINYPTTSLAAGREQIPDYSAEAWSNIYPVIRDSVKAINSFYELKDFARLPALARETSRGIREIGDLSRGYKWTSESARKGELSFIYQMMEPQSADVWSRLLQMPRRRAEKLSLAGALQRLVTVGKVSAAHFLNWKFALSPLIRDMEAFSGVSRTVARQLPGLLERADGKTVHKTHWAKGLDPAQVAGFEPLSREDENWSGPYAQVYTKPWCEMTYGPKYTFTARYSYKYSPEAHEIAQKLAMLDALGVNPSANNLWQAIPWSFMIDWFATVGKSLEALTPHNLEPIVYFYGASHSLKYEIVVGMDCQVYSDAYKTASNDYAYSGCGPRTVATRTMKCYIRKSVIPLVSLPKTSDFSTIEKLLAMALGLSSVRYNTV